MSLLTAVVSSVTWSFIAAQSNVVSPNVVNPRSYGGEPVQISDHPYFVLMIDLVGNRRCGGVFITKRWILTAARCLVDEEGVAGRLQVHYGTPSWTIEGNMSYGRAYPHPQFNLSDKETWKFDIGLVKMPDEVSVQPMGLPGPNYDAGLIDSDSDLDPANRVTVLAAGETLMKHSKPLDKKLTAKQFHTHLSRYRCNLFDQYIDYYHEVCFISYPPKHVYLMCEGDAGAPLIHQIDNNKTIVAVYSHSNTDCKMGPNDFAQRGKVVSYSVRVTSAMLWILHSIEWQSEDESLEKLTQDWMYHTPIGDVDVR